MAEMMVGREVNFHVDKAPARPGPGLPLPLLSHLELLGQVRRQVEFWLMARRQ